MFWRKCFVGAWMFAILFSFSLSGQNAAVHHWETPVNANDQWEYLLPSSEPSSAWRNVGFVGTSWQTGNGGIGYGDGDDNTLISPTLSVYLRREFQVFDTSSINAIIFSMDYDDAFVAYLNGIEVARSNIGTPGTPPTFNTSSLAQHEALMYQGGTPESFTLAATLANQVLNLGTNVLAVQVHNATLGSSDMSAAPFLHFGIGDSSYFYGSNPNWFFPPMISSDLPLVMINTFGQAIVDNPRIVAHIGMIDNGHGNRNFLTDPFNAYDGRVSIEHRGSTSQGFPKKPYAFETQDSVGNNLNVSLLGMPIENDWILQNPYSDKTLMRNFLTYSLVREMGNYTSRTRFCEVLLNGDYQGVYILMEQIKWDKNRVDVETMDPDDIVGDSLTGGYIVKVDKTTAGAGIHWSSPIINFQGQAKNIGFQFDYPKPGSITPHQESYIQSKFNEMEYALVDSSFADPAIGYHKYIDVHSFIDFFIINEITKNVDGYRLSTYLHKQRDSRGGKIRMGPAWDFNLGFANANYCAGGTTDGWALDFPCDQSVIPFWWHRLMQDSVYNKLLRCRWDELRNHTLSTPKLMNQIDSIASILQESSIRNFEKWPVFGTYLWPNHYIGNSYQEDLDSMKAWITRRLTWIDSNLPGSSANCASPAENAVTLNEINYNSNPALNSEDWFEIKNTSTTDVDLSNWTFKDRNNFNSFTFPDSTWLLAGGHVVLSRNQQQFSWFNQIPNAIGSFNFGLNGVEDEIRLWDAHGFPVLNASYSSAVPWPQLANGHGWTLEYKDSLSLSDPGSWFAGCLGGSPGEDFSPCNYPLIISEINYNSADTADAGDWIEILNQTSDSVNLSGVIFASGNDFFSIPSGTMLAPQDRIVLYQQTVTFELTHPDVALKAGPFNFNLHDDFGDLGLYDNSGGLLFSMSYNDSFPWPVLADGLGFTLELADSAWQYHEGASWFAGCPGGSPGTPFVFPCPVSPVDTSNTGLSNYLSSDIRLQFDSHSGNLSITSNLNGKVSIYNLAGQLVDTDNLLAGVTTRLLIAGTPGLYLVKFDAANSIVTKKILKAD